MSMPLAPMTDKAPTESKELLVSLLELFDFVPKLLVFNRRIDCLLLPTVLVQSHWYAVVDLVLEFFVFGDLEKLVFDAFVFQLYNLSLQPFGYLLLFIRRDGIR